MQGPNSNSVCQKMITVCEVDHFKKTAINRSVDSSNIQ